MYAIIEVGGKQFSVEKGSKVRCETIELKANELMTIDKVLLISDGQKVQIGTPYLKGAVVKAKVTCHGRAKKITGLKYKNKTNYRRAYGHRQNYTAIQIEEIKG